MAKVEIFCCTGTAVTVNFSFIYFKILHNAQWRSKNQYLERGHTFVYYSCSAQLLISFEIDFFDGL